MMYVIRYGTDSPVSRITHLYKLLTHTKVITRHFIDSFMMRWRCRSKVVGFGSRFVICVYPG
jgi:hypothetical protein